jgi:hypothetical protein
LGPISNPEALTSGRLISPFAKQHDPTVAHRVEFSVSGKENSDLSNSYACGGKKSGICTLTMEAKLENYNCNNNKKLPVSNKTKAEIAFPRFRLPTDSIGTPLASRTTAITPAADHATRIMICG